MIILVDMDGVLSDFDKCHAVKGRALGFPEYMTPATRKTWQIFDGFKQDEIDAILDLWYSPGFFRDMPPIEGAQKAMEDMVAHGYEVFICSTPMKGHPTCSTEKEAWIKEHLGKDFLGRLILTQDKTLIHGHILIDDKPVITGRHFNPSWEHVLYDTSYNRHDKEKRRLTWANWREVIG